MQLGGGNDDFSNTSSMNNMQLGGGNDDFSNTSSMHNMQLKKKIQQGGQTNQSAKSNELNNDITKLLSMLASESNSEQSTTTSKLEYNIKNKILNNNTQAGGNSSNVDEVKKFFINLKNQGVNVNIKLDDKSLSDFFNLSQNTTTDLNNNLSATSSHIMYGGKKEMSEGFKLHLDFKKYIADKLGISNGVKPNKIIKLLKEEVRQKYAKITDKKEIHDKCMKMFNDNIEKYKKML